MPALTPEVQRIFDSLQFDVKPGAAGPGAVIQGIRCDEAVSTISLAIPNPSGQSVSFRMELHTWVAAASEMDRNPALKELAAFTRRSSQGIDPTEMVMKALSAIPGLGPKMGDVLRELNKDPGRPPLKLNIALFVPALAAAGAGSADAPPMRYGMELTEISTAPIPDSVFEIPTDYQPAALQDLMTVLTPAAPQFTPPVALRPATVASPSASPQPPAANVTQPRKLSGDQPAYTPEARAAKIEGTVLLGVVVNADGSLGDIRVVHSLSPDLDQKAIEAVSQWKFVPATRDGKPVSVQAQIEVNFRLM